MATLTKTNRSYKDVETGNVFNLCTDQSGRFHLIAPEPAEANQPSEGTEVNGYYLCAHSGVTIKINNTKLITMDRGEFYNMKEGEVITHKKFLGFDKFTKVK